MIAEIAWPTALVLVSLLGYFGFLRWLGRETTTVRELKAELTETQSDWEKRFTKYEHAHDALVTRVNNATPGQNPLGKHYSTRSG